MLLDSDPATQKHSRFALLDLRPQAAVPARVRPLLAITLAVLLTAGVSSAAMASEKFLMDGKPVGKAQYDAIVLVNESTFLLRSNRNKEAGEKCEQALQIMPTLAEAHHNYALALAKQGKTDEAIAQFRQALDLNSTLNSTWLSLGGLYQASGRLTEAVETYRQFLSRFPRDKDAAKVSNLMQGLRNELQVDAARPPRSVDDYYLEATREGLTRWPRSKMPLKVFIHSGLDTPGYRDSYGHILRQCFQEWAEASRGLVTFGEVRDPRLADIECFWVTKLSNNAESGETRLSRIQNTILKANIKLLTVPFLPEQSMTDNVLRTIILHEIGHAIGLNGHTTNPKDAMFFASQVADLPRSLSTRDANTVLRLYTAAALDVYTPANRGTLLPPNAGRSPTRPADQQSKLQPGRSSLPPPAGSGNAAPKSGSTTAAGLDSQKRTVDSLSQPGAVAPPSPTTASTGAGTVDTAGGSTGGAPSATTIPAPATNPDSVPASLPAPASNQNSTSSPDAQSVNGGASTSGAPTTLQNRGRQTNGGLAPRTPQGTSQAADDGGGTARSSAVVR